MCWRHVIWEFQRFLKKIPSSNCRQCHRREFNFQKIRTSTLQRQQRHQCWLRCCSPDPLLFAATLVWLDNTTNNSNSNSNSNTTVCSLHDNSFVVPPLRLLLFAAAVVWCCRPQPFRPALHMTELKIYCEALNFHRQISQTTETTKTMSFTWNRFKFKILQKTMMYHRLTHLHTPEEYQAAQDWMDNKNKGGMAHTWNGILPTTIGLANLSMMICPIGRPKMRRGSVNNACKFGKVRLVLNTYIVLGDGMGWIELVCLWFLLSWFSYSRLTLIPSPLSKRWHSHSRKPQQSLPVRTIPSCRSIPNHILDIFYHFPRIGVWSWRRYVPAQLSSTVDY